MSNVWRSLNIPLINCEIELILTWFKNCVLISKAAREAGYDANAVVRKIDNPENAIYEIKDAKMFLLLLCQKKMT